MILAQRKAFWVKIKPINKEEEGNISVTSTEMREMKEYMQGRRGTVIRHEHEDRRVRRQPENTGRILNNRKNPAKRFKVLVRMSLYSLWLTHNRNKRA